MKTEDHICQQFPVEFGRVSAMTGALLGEASRDARLRLRNDTRMVEHLWSIQIAIKCLYTPYIYDILILG